MTLMVNLKLSISPPSRITNRFVLFRLKKKQRSHCSAFSVISLLLLPLPNTSIAWGPVPGFDKNVEYYL